MAVMWPGGSFPVSHRFFCRLLFFSSQVPRSHSVSGALLRKSFPHKPRDDGRPSPNARKPLVSPGIALHNNFIRFGRWALDNDYTSIRTNDSPDPEDS